MMCLSDPEEASLASILNTTEGRRTHVERPLAGDDSQRPPKHHSCVKVICAALGLS